LLFHRRAIVASDELWAGESDARLAEIAAGLERRPRGSAQPDGNVYVAEPAANGVGAGEEPAAVGASGGENPPRVAAGTGKSVKGKPGSVRLRRASDQFSFEPRSNGS